VAPAGVFAHFLDRCNGCEGKPSSSRQSEVRWRRRPQSSEPAKHPCYAVKLSEILWQYAISPTCIGQIRIGELVTRPALITGITGQDCAYLGGSSCWKKAIAVHVSARVPHSSIPIRIDHCTSILHERNVTSQLHYGALTDCDSPDPDIMSFIQSDRNLQSRCAEPCRSVVRDAE